MLHDAPHLVHHQQPGPGVLGGGGPHRLGADHRGGRTQLRLQQVQVEDRDQGLAGQQVVALVGEQVPQAAGGEGPQQVGDFPELDSGSFRRSLPGRRRSPGSRCAPASRRSRRPGRGPGMERRSALSRSPTITSIRRRRLPMRCKSSSESPRSMTKGFMPWPGTPGDSTLPPAALAMSAYSPFRVDDVGPHAPAQAPQHPQLGGKGFPRTGPGQDRRVGVEMGAVEGVVDDGGAGPQVDAVQGPAPGVQVRRREGKQPRQRRGVQRPPHRHGVQAQGQGGQQSLPLPEGQVVQLAQRGGEVGPGLLGQISFRVSWSSACKRDGQRGVEEPFPASFAPRPGGATRPPGRSPPPATWSGPA